MTWTCKIGVLPALLLGTATLAGCAQTDPFNRAGIWQPSGANAANIASMAANPADLTRGRGDPPSNLRTATGAVERLWKGPTAPRANSGGPQQGDAAPNIPGPGGAQR